MTKNTKDGEYAFIGQRLGVVEEYLPDKKSTYADKGVIYATRSGRIYIDSHKKKISVKRFDERKRQNMIIGDIVIGMINFVRKYSVGVEVYIINNNVKFYSGYLGNVHVSQISRNYIEKIEDALQKTDIIRARVSKLKYNEVNLVTDQPNLGVISADCSRCGAPLYRTKRDLLKCEICENVEKRKLANDYGSVKTRLIF